MIFRYSTLADADECYRKYYEKHIVKSVKEDSSLDLQFGTAMHLAIKTHYEGGDALSMFSMYWGTLQNKPISQRRYTWDQLKDLGEKFILRFIKKYAEQFKPLQIEKELRMTMEGHTYQGTLDMLCEYDGLVTLIDWKTSGSVYNIKKIHTNGQLYGYAALAELEFKIKIEQLMYFVFVKSTGNIQTNIKLQLERSKLDDMVGNIKLKVKDLSTRELWPQNDLCKYCVCNRYKGVS